MDFSNVVAQEETTEGEGELAALTSADGASPKALPAIWSEVSKNFMLLTYALYKSNFFTC